MHGKNTMFGFYWLLAAVRNMYWKTNWWVTKSDQHTSLNQSNKACFFCIFFVFFFLDPDIASKHYLSAFHLLLECGNATVCTGLIKTLQPESDCTQISPTLCNTFSQCWLRLAASDQILFSVERGMCGRSHFSKG